jgi:hypothetical protein
VGAIDEFVIANRWFCTFLSHIASEAAYCCSEEVLAAEGHRRDDSKIKKGGAA